MLKRAAVILTICVAALTLLGAAGAAATANWRMGAVERKAEATEAVSTRHGERLSAIDANYIHINNSLTRIEKWLGIPGPDVREPPDPRTRPAKGGR